MDSFQQSERIKELQDHVVTLRHDMSVCYKRMLMKECQVIANNLAEAKVSFPRQNLDQLQNIRPADLSRATQSIRTNPPMHEILTQARQLQRFQQMDRKKH